MAPTYSIALVFLFVAGFFSEINVFGARAAGGDIEGHGPQDDHAPDGQIAQVHSRLVPWVRRSARSSVM